VLLEAASEQQEAEWLAERIAQALAEGAALNDIAVLCRTKALMRPIEHALHRRKIDMQSMGAVRIRHFDWHRPSVKLLTLHSAKGLEFPRVFLASLQAMPLPDESPEDAVRLLYVGMTRATHELVLSAVQPQDGPESALVARVRQAIAQVGTAFAQPAGGV
jgi:superfamily I DNA/RNA helicase